MKKCKSKWAGVDPIRIVGGWVGMLTKLQLENLSHIFCLFFQLCKL